MQFVIHRHSVGLGALLLGLVLVISGCSSSPKVIDPSKRSGFDLGEFKRYEKHMQRDFIHHFSRKVYEEPSKRRMRKNRNERLLVEGLGLQLSDRAELLDELGDPSLVRKKFKSREGEKVEEWVFRDAAEVAQFIDGQLAYRGPLTDLEGLLIIHGYPNTYNRSQYIPDGEIQIFIYQSVFSPNARTYHLVNDILASKQEGK